MLLLYVALVYLTLGLIFSFVFLISWIKKVDETAGESSWSFKLTILPGCIIFWPVLLKKYIVVIRTKEND